MATCRMATSRPATRRGSPAGSTPSPPPGGCFWFHQPETLVDEIAEWVHRRTGALRARIPDLPLLAEHPAWLCDAQAEAIRNLEVSLKANRSRALIQMATGSGKTFCAANVCERLLDHKKGARARRILFLVDRANLGRQTLKEFQGFEVPGSGRKFTELYNTVLGRGGREAPNGHLSSSRSWRVGLVRRVSGKPAPANRVSQRLVHRRVDAANGRR